MADLSNKTLSMFLLVAIVVSVTGTIVTFNKMGGEFSDITGFATSGTGITNFTISQDLSITFTNDRIPFGSGTVNQSIPTFACKMGSNGTNPSTANGCIGFNTTVSNANLTIENNGNVFANVTLNFTKNATTFIGGNDVSPEFKYQVRNVDASACASLPYATSMTEVGTNATDHNTVGTRVCTNFNHDTTDVFDVAVWLVVPRDATPGEHTVTITARACNDASC